MKLKLKLPTFSRSWKKPSGVLRPADPTASPTPVNTSPAIVSPSAAPPVNTLSPNPAIKTPQGPVFAKIGSGCAAVMAALGIAYWLEDTAVRNFGIYMDGPGQVIHLSTPQVLPENEGKLVWFTGDLVLREGLVDRELGVSVETPAMRRTTQMLQWLEKEEEVSDTDSEGKEIKRKAYSYYYDWSDKYYGPFDFKVVDEAHQNPPMVFKGKEWKSETANVGPFQVPTIEIKQFVPYSVPETLKDKFPAEWQPLVKFKDGKFYIGTGTPTDPQLGDTIIAYEIAAPNQKVSVIGAQSGPRIVPFSTRHHGEILKTQPGVVANAEAFFRPMPSGFDWWVWLIRAGWIALLGIGAYLVVWNGAKLLPRPLSRIFKQQAVAIATLSIATLMLYVFWSAPLAAWWWVWLIVPAGIALDLLYRAIRFMRLRERKGWSQLIKKRGHKIAAPVPNASPAEPQPPTPSPTIIQ